MKTYYMKKYIINVKCKYYIIRKTIASQKSKVKYDISFFNELNSHKSI